MLWQVLLDDSDGVRIRPEIQTGGVGRGDDVDRPGEPFVDVDGDLGFGIDHTTLDLSDIIHDGSFDLNVMDDQAEPELIESSTLSRSEQDLAIMADAAREERYQQLLQSDCHGLFTELGLLPEQTCRSGDDEVVRSLAGSFVDVTPGVGMEGGRGESSGVVPSPAQTDVNARPLSYSQPMARDRMTTIHPTRSNVDDCVHRPRSRTTPSWHACTLGFNVPPARNLVGRRSNVGSTSSGAHLGPTPWRRISGARTLGN